MAKKQRVLVAGATGYLGRFIVKELKRQRYWIRALSRNVQKIEPVRQYVDDVFLGRVTQPESIKGICRDIDHVIVRPNGFFSDMTEFFNMAKKGRIYLFGSGEFRGNPIHGADLAKACVDRFRSYDGDFDIGGPEILSQNQIARQAFEVLGKPPKITCIPLWLKNFIMKFARTCTSSKTYGPLEFFLTVLAMDMIAPTFGERTLKEHFMAINEASDA